LTTAVDSSVLLDLLGGDPTFGPRSKAAFDLVCDQGAVVSCEIVWAEVSSFFPSSDAAREALEHLGLGFSPMTREASLAAGKGWAEYRRRGGLGTRVVADFLVGAHALLQADRLLTRDAGFHRSCFAGIEIFDPAAGS